MLLLLFWSLPAVVVASQLTVQLQAAGRDPSWTRMLAIQLLRWWPWALLTPWIQKLARRHRPTAAAWLRPTAVLTLVAAVLLPASVAYGMFIDLSVFQGIRMDAATWLSRTARGSVLGLPVFLIVFGGILAVTYLRDLSAQYQRRQLEAERLRSDLADARLQALQFQLQPHFLFNTLHAIASIMEEDVPRARRMTAQLGGLLRATLELSDEPLVALRREVRLAELYLDIERTRFEDRLQVEWDIDAAALDVEVPTLTLQPLIENAVRHGVGAHAKAGRLAISARRVGECLRLEVRDDGAGPPASPRFGVGLSSIAGRLQERHGERASLELQAVPAGGCVAVVNVPWSS